MKIVHTGDWHIGQTLAGYARDHEHAAVLSALERICVEHDVSALIVAGDIFEHHNPSGTSQQLFYSTLLALRRACPSMTIVVTAGNHDAAGRLEAPAMLLRELNVHVIGNARRIDGRLDAERHLIALPGCSNMPEAHLLAVSYPTPACLPPFGSLATDAALSSIVEATRTFYEELWEGSGAGRDDLPVIVTGHLHVMGATESEGAERRILIGGQHAVPADIFPGEAAYVALGHLHKAQAVGRDNIRYCGSLLPLSATEAGYQHGVTLLALEGGRLTSCEHLPLPRLVPFLRLPQLGLDEMADHLATLRLDRDLPVERQPFVQIQLKRDGLQPGHRARVDQIAGEHPVRVVGVSVARPDAVEISADAIATPVARLAELQPLEMFRKAFAELHHGVAPDAKHELAFHAALAAAEAEV